MKEFDWAKVQNEKTARRLRNANETFASKLNKLDALRDRSRAIKDGVVRPRDSDPLPPREAHRKK